MYRIAMQNGKDDKIILVGDKFTKEILEMVKMFLAGDKLNSKSIKISRA
jgi:hypothetical protein